MKQQGIMRNTLPLAALLLFIGLAPVLTPPSVHAQQTDTTLSLIADEQRVLEVEDEYVAAEVSRDEATLRRLVDDRFQHNRSDGTTTGKEELIQGLLKMSMVDQTISERSVLLEDDIALIFGTAAIQMKGADGEVSVWTLRYTSTYVNRDGQWRMLALQMQNRSQE